MDFLPMPHEVTYGNGTFVLTHRTVIRAEAEPAAARLLQREILEQAGLRLNITRGAAREGEILLCMDPALPENTYTLDAYAQGVRAAGGSGEALFHACATLCQWVRRHGAVLPELHVKDWPDLKYRGYYLDCSRGRIPTLDTLKRYADLLCRYKINEWQLYIEHTYLFRDMSECWREDTPLTADEILELDEYCAARHIELVPSLSTFGHMYGILRTRTYSDLCELENSEEGPYLFTGEMAHHTVNCTDPRALPLVKGMIEEYLPLFRSRRFNICCDETFDLAKGRSAAEAERLGGARELYMDYVSELCRWLAEKGITPMFWGDIVLRWPEAYSRLPKETVCLNWHYSPVIEETDIRTLAQQGAVQYVCPGVQTWNRFFPAVRDSYENISRMCLYGQKYGAIGLLNTDWGDYGHVCDPRLSVPGILYGAAFAWNAQPVPYNELNRAADLLEYGDREGGFTEALAGLCGCEVYTWGHLIRRLEKGPSDAPRDAYDAAALPAASEKLEEALRRFSAAVPRTGQAGRELAQAVSLAAEAADLCNAFGLWLESGENGPELAARWENWLQDYLKEWRRVSREGGVYHLRDTVCRIADILRGKEAMPE